MNYAMIKGKWIVDYCVSAFFKSYVCKLRRI